MSTDECCIKLKKTTLSETVDNCRIFPTERKGIHTTKVDQRSERRYGFQVRSDPLGQNRLPVLHKPLLFLPKFNPSFHETISTLPKFTSFTNIYYLLSCR